MVFCQNGVVLFNEWMKNSNNNNNDKKKKKPTCNYSSVSTQESKVGHGRSQTLLHFHV